MTKFFDREPERKSIHGILKDIEEKSSCILWIEGQSGVGKSSLLDYAISHSKNEILKFSGDQSFYKCNKGNVDDSYSCIVGLLITLEKEEPTLFFKSVESYFSKFAHVSLLDSAAEILSSIVYFKWSKELIKKSQKRKNLLFEKMSQRLVDKHIESCFVDVICKLLFSKYKDKPVILCIDDVVNIDKTSLNIICSVFRKLNETKSPALSLILTTRDYYSITEKELYSEVEDSFRRLTNNFSSIIVENFSQSITGQFLLSINREMLARESNSIYSLTKGNLQEITQLIKLSDAQVEKKIIDITSSEVGMANLNLGFQPIISQSLVFECLTKDSLTKAMLFLLYYIEKEIDLLQFTNVIELYLSKYENEILLEHRLNASYELLISNGLVNISNSISVSHDSVKDITKQYFTEFGLINSYVDNFSDLIVESEVFSEAIKPDAKVSLAVRNLKEFNPKKAINIFFKFCGERDNYRPPLSMVKNLSECFSYNFTLLNEAKYIELAAELVDVLVKYASLPSAIKLCNLLWDKKNTLEKDGSIRFSLNFLRALVDEGIYESNVGYGALEICELIREQDMSKELLIEFLLVKNSMNEHLLNYSEMSSNTDLILQHLGEIEKGRVLSKLKAIYLRNLGLVKFHKELTLEYKEAVNLTEKRILEFESESDVLLLGTCWNNLGQTFFFKGNVEAAIEAFTKSKELLESVKYDTHRPINNIAACYLLSGRFEEAARQLLAAKQTTYRGIFEEISIDLNYVIALWFLGEKEFAKDRLAKYVSQYRSGELLTPDTWVYAGALYTMGYFEYDSGNYLEAAKIYKESKFHVYRFCNAEQQNRREEMIRACLIKEGLLGENNLQDINMDFNDQLLDFFKKPFDIQLLAFYVI